MKNKILQISLVGNTNSGKSTFLNRVIGKNISITSKRINTTLESITGVLNKKNNQILLYDTPGLSFLKSKDQKNKLLKINLWQSIENSKLVLYFIDSKNKNLILNNDLLKEIKSKNQKIFLILNKIDLIKKNHLLLKMDYLYRKYNVSNIYPVSAIKNIGIQKLLDDINKLTIEGNWIYKKHDITDKNDLFISNEITRESILFYLNEEIPYSIVIKNKKWKIIKKNNLVIFQDILIKKIAYKKIILGKNGSMIKKVREKSQKKISEFFNKKTHLYLNIVYHK